MTYDFILLCSKKSVLDILSKEILVLYREMRGVSIHKGVNAFDYCAKANIIATGGVDKVIRVWHPHIFSRPTGNILFYNLQIQSV